jgi:hypothetical protein
MGAIDTLRIFRKLSLDIFDLLNAAQTFINSGYDPTLFIKWGHGDQKLGKEFPREPFVGPQIL